YQGLLLVTAAVMFLMMGLMMGPFYKAIPEESLKAFEGLPEAMIALAGGGNIGNISTPEGWYQVETFGLMAPISVMVVTIAIGAGALAGEESRRTIGLLLANPVRRSRVVLEKSWTMTLYAFAVGFATFAGVALGSLLADLGMDIGHIAATCLLQTLLGLAFGALALILSAGTGRTRIAVFVTIGAALVLHLFNGFAVLNESMAEVAQWLPFYYYLGNDPLNNGLDWSHAAILAGLAVVLIALSVLLFERRDLRQTG
ncbi:MAG: ABC transporter permease subunit, partial [Chloroflexota bacterium]|nr:ABC transporter permease subunit [Chloroflexota bacterium]